MYKKILLCVFIVVPVILLLGSFTEYQIKLISCCGILLPIGVWLYGWAYKDF